MRSSTWRRVAPPTKPRAALKHQTRSPVGRQQLSCTTHKAACGMGAPIGSLCSPLPPHRRGKLILRDSTRKRSLTKPPLRERGRGTAKRWWGRKGIAACGIETPHIRVHPISDNSCTTHKAACGIETFEVILVRIWKEGLHHPQSRVRH